MIKDFFSLIKIVLTRNILFSFINVFGLAVGLSAFLLITVWVVHTLSFEDFNVNARYIYRVITEIEGEQSSALSVSGLAGALKEKYPQVVQSCRVAPYFKNAIVKNKDKVFREPQIIAADTNFFRLLSYNLLRGNSKIVLDGPDKIVLTESMAVKYFGSDDPVGKSITIITGNSKREMEISGIVEDDPGNSHLKFDFIVSNITGNKKFNKEDPWFNWELLNWSTYIQLTPGVKYKSFETTIRDLVKQNYPSSRYRLGLQPLKRIYLFSGNLTDAGLVCETGDIRHVKIMSVAAFLILFTACLNFMILQFACSIRRIREIGIKKIFGSARRRIVGNLMLELLIFVVIALFISMIILGLVFPSFSQFIGLEPNGKYPDCRFIFASIGILSGILFLTGLYPSLLLSSFKPYMALKGVANLRVAGISVLKSLMVFQLLVSLILLISTMVMNRQLKLIRNFDPGLNTGQIVYFPCDDIPYDYRTGIRDFSREIVSDDSAYIINEAAAKALNIESPVGKTLTYIFRGTDSIPGKILGITRDFHFNTLYNKIEPLVIGIQVGRPGYIFVRTNSKNNLNIISELDKTIKRIYPDKITEYRVLSQSLEQQYQNEFKVGKIFNLFCVLTLVLTMLGLFGQSVFSVQTRTKEIGIRKVNGASISAIIRMLLLEFIMLLIIAFLIAAPVAFYIMNKWLQNFAYKIRFDILIFLEAGFLALTLVFITVIWQSYRQAEQNVTDVLRSE